MPIRTSRIRWGDVLLCVVPVLYLIFLIVEIVDYIRTDAQGYPIGWEGGGWSFREFHNYWISLLLSSVIPAIGIALFLCQKRALRIVARMATGAVTLLLAVGFASAFAAPHFEPLGPALNVINHVTAQILCLGLCGPMQ